ncbi:MAG TPA: ATP-binding protein, partial [Candidatus Sumerlaeota bacterium]|nr:ATP-binding protein [Candidatus Sumerlaeota bacterium]
DLRRSMKEINEQTGQISLLYDIAQAINAALDLDLIFADLAQQMKKIVEFDFLGVCLAPEGESNFTSIVLFPEDAHEDSEPASILLSRSRFENVMESRIPVVIQDLMYEGLTNQDARLQASGIRSCLLLHLHSASGVIGMLVLAHNQAGTYGEREIRLVSRICEAVAIAVEHSRLYSRIRRFAQELEEKVAQRTLQLQETHTNMVRTEKLAASGKLAASLAHEINNPLGIIKNYLKIFTDQWHAHAARLESAGLSLEPLEIVREELDRIARIVRGLLDLYGPAEARRMMTDINAEAMRLVQLMRQSLEKKGVAVHVALGKDLPRSFLTPDHVTQILLNILTNAEDATPSGGSISIATSFIPPAGPVSGDDRGFIEVVVKDTGCGIPPEIMGSIFDPFFTTKKKGAATGLGLFVIHGLLEGMGGKIIINSDPGRGTNIRILFPLIPEIPPATT